MNDEFIDKNKYWEAQWHIDQLYEELQRSDD